jgi:hypothetical protein
LDALTLGLPLYRSRLEPVVKFRVSRQQHGKGISRELIASDQLLYEEVILLPAAR